MLRLQRAQLTDPQGELAFAPVVVQQPDTSPPLYRFTVPLPAGLSAGESTDIVGNFAALGCRRMVISRLDNARRLGGVLAAAQAGPALVAAGIGPMIGSGLKPLTAIGLARLLMSKAGHGESR